MDLKFQLLQFLIFLVYTCTPNGCETWTGWTDELHEIHCPETSDGFRMPSRLLLRSGGSRNSSGYVGIYVKRRADGHHVRGRKRDYMSDGRPSVADEGRAAVLRWQAGRRDVLLPNERWPSLRRPNRGSTAQIIETPTAPLGTEPVQLPDHRMPNLSVISKL